MRATAYGSYHGGLRELIHLLRYARVRPAAKVPGRMLAEVIDELECDFLGDRVAVVPLRLHRGKLRQLRVQPHGAGRTGCNEKYPRIRGFASLGEHSKGNAKHLRKPALPGTSAGETSGAPSEWSNMKR